MDWKSARSSRHGVRAIPLKPRDRHHGLPVLERLGAAFPGIAAKTHFHHEHHEKHEDMSLVLIGASGGEHVAIDVLYRADPDATDADDGNWLESEIAIRAGAWSGRFRAALRAEDFPAFRKQLAALYRDLAGVAGFSTMEEWLTLKLVGDRHGHISIEGEAIDVCGIGNRLLFHFAIDQSYLPAAIEQLEGIEQAFPCRGMRLL